MRGVRAFMTALAAGSMVAVAMAVPVAADVTYAPPVVLRIAPIVPAADGSAFVTATYQCYGGQGGGSHLYIGLKQGPKVNARNHTSSSWATTFYSTNWNFFVNDGLTATCDGTVRTDTFELQPDPFWAHAEDAPPLRTGAAFVQFCVFDSTNSGAEDDLTGFGFKYQMRGVLAK
jgi:hypothetical protein